MRSPAIRKKDIEKYEAVKSKVGQGFYEMKSHIVKGVKEYNYNTLLPVGFNN